MRKRNRRQRLFKALSGVLLTVTLLGSLLAFQGCGLLNKQVVLFPIEQSDIVLLKGGEQFTAPKQGAFLSDLYIQEVMEAKIK